MVKIVQYITTSTAVPAFCQLSCRQVSSESRNKGAACFQWALKNHQMMEIFSHYELLTANMEKLLGRAVLEELSLQICYAEIGLTFFQNNHSA